MVVNKTDLAPLVGADLQVMSRDADAVRAGRPTVLQSLTEDPAATAVLAWVRAQLAAADAL
ncbi:putative urease accessory protein ureG [Mycobacterium kansasii]|uniref:Putative urease accessory protein ureG n=1 Tax=Mycobacterium kansasii TaxID=1768 RepID=A0A1V3X5L4_MYCKA|nr:putative urease accessory protein ureG [Mycobacterium kansasii]